MGGCLLTGVRLLVVRPSIVFVSYRGTSLVVSCMKGRRSLGAFRERLPLRAALRIPWPGSRLARNRCLR